MVMKINIVAQNESIFQLIFTQCPFTCDTRRDFQLIIQLHQSVKNMSRGPGIFEMRSMRRIEMIDSGRLVIMEYHVLVIRGFLGRIAGIQEDSYKCDE